MHLRRALLKVMLVADSWLTAGGWQVCAVAVLKAEISARVAISWVMDFMILFLFLMPKILLFRY